MSHSLVLQFILLLGVVALAGCSQEEISKPTPVKPVKTFAIEAIDTHMKLVYPGKVKANRKVELAFRVAGALEELPVKRGQDVQKGQLIARLDQDDFITKVNDLNSRLAGAKASLKEAEANFKRSQKLLEDDIIAKATFDNALATVENARAAVRSTEQQLKQARLDLNYTTLKAPFSGTVALKHVNNFQTVQRQEPIVSFEDIDSLDIVIDIPEFIWAMAQDQIRSGIVLTPPSAVFAAYPDMPFPLELKEFETKANPQTQTYAVTLTMERPVEFSILPGMTAEVTGFLQRSDGEQGFLVPLPAVVGLEDGTAYCWALVGSVGDQSVKRKTVEVGEVKGDFILVTNGLESGDTIVAAGAHYLVEGQKVRPLEGKIGE